MLVNAVALFGGKIVRFSSKPVAVKRDLTGHGVMAPHSGDWHLALGRGPSQNSQDTEFQTTQKKFDGNTFKLTLR